jgi:hypothetical protein
MSENASGQTVVRQHQWCWCRKCQGLFFAAGISAGVCPAGESHDRAGSADYHLAVNAAGLAGQSIPGQSGWRWCAKCQALHYTRESAAGVCPAGGGHENAGSAEYTLDVDVPEAAGQPGWRWCHRCGVLFFGDFSGGVCPAGGAHDPAASGHYVLPVGEASQTTVPASCC